MSYKCVGCDRDIGWDGKGTLCLTCVCGSHTFYGGDGTLVLPHSLISALYYGSMIPHLDYLVGESDHTSPIKERLITELREKGAVWMEECEQCQKDGTLARRQEREKHLALREAEQIVRTIKGDKA